MSRWEPSRGGAVGAPRWWTTGSALLRGSSGTSRQTRTQSLRTARVRKQIYTQHNTHDPTYNYTLTQSKCPPHPILNPCHFWAVSGRDTRAGLPEVPRECAERRPVKALRGGERTRLRVAKLLFSLTRQRRSKDFSIAPPRGGKSRKKVDGSPLRMPVQVR